MALIVPPMTFSMRAAIKRAAQILFAQAVDIWAQFRRVWSVQSQRIEVGDQMPSHPILSYQVVDPVLDSREPKGLVHLVELIGPEPATILDRAIGLLLLVRATDDQELLEVLAPSLGNARGVADVLDVQVVDVVQTVVIHGGGRPNLVADQLRAVAGRNGAWRHSEDGKLQFRESPQIAVPSDFDFRASRRGGSGASFVRVLAKLQPVHKIVADFWHRFLRQFLAMAVLIQVRDAQKRFGDQLLLDAAELSLVDDVKVGFIGRNGAGKSTLLRVLLGEEELEKGEVIHHPTLRIGYLRQHDPFLAGESALDFLMRDSDQPEWRCGEVAGQFELKGAYLEGPVKELSGGWQTRVKLAALLLHNPNLSDARRANELPGPSHPDSARAFFARVQQGSFDCQPRSGVPVGDLLPNVGAFPRQADDVPRQDQCLPGVSRRAS